MRIYIIILAVLTAGVLSSCSSPSPEAQNYINNNQETKSAQTSSNPGEAVDVTKQAPTTAPNETEAAEKTTTGEGLKQVVSPKNFPKAIDQFAGAKKVWESIQVAQKKSGTTPFLYKIEQTAFVNGEPLVQMKAEKTPVPLFITWDTTKIQGIDQIQTLIQSGTQIQIKSRHSSPSGNWYLVTNIDTGMENVKGWIPEKLLSNVNTGTYGGFQHKDVEGDATGRGGRRRGGGGGPGGGG
jgi:hypothetical protein